MRISKITTKGLRATDREVELAPLSLIRGPIGSGKTSIGDAIRVAVLGYVPGIGKDSTAVARIMRESALEVGLTFDDGSRVTRGYARDGKKLAGYAEASWLPPRAKLTEVAEAIRGLAGQDDREAAEHLDLRTLLSASAAERARRIEELLDASGIPSEELARRARALLPLRLAAVDPDRMPAGLAELEGAAKGALSLLTPAVVRALPPAMEQLGGWISEGGVPAAIDGAREAKRTASEGLRRSIAARAEIEDRVNGLRAPAEALADLERRREEAVGRRAAAKRDLEEAVRIASLRSGLEPALPGLRQVLAEAEEALAEARQRLPRAEQALAECSELRDPPAVVAPPVLVADAEQIAAAEALLAEAAECRREAESIVIPEMIFAAKEEAAAVSARKALQKAEQSAWRTVELIAGELWDIVQRVATTEERGALLVVVNRLRSLASEQGGDWRDLVREAEEADRMFRAALEVSEARAKVIDEARKRQNERRSRNNELQARAAELRKTAEDAARAANRAARNAYATECADREVAVAENQDRRRELRYEADQIRSSAVDAQSAADKAKAALASAEERLAGIASATADPEAARKSHESAVAEIAECEEKVKALRGAQALREEMARMIAEIDRATAERDVWTAAEWAGQRLREMDLAARSRGLEELMRRYLRAAGRQEDPYLRAARGVLDFGWRREGKEISVEALSGGETAIFCSALAGAIISLRKPPLRLLLVEGAEVGVGPESGQLLALCEAMVVCGDLDQVIVATCLPVEAPETWAKIDLARAVEAVAA